MRFDNRTTITWRGHRWVVACPSVLNAEERGAKVDGSVAASMVSEWCRDATIWPDMLLLYEDVSGDRLRPPSSSDVEQRVVPRFRRAFEHGNLCVVRTELFGKTARQTEKGVHGRHPEKLPEPPSVPGPRKISRIAPEKTFLEVQVLDTDGEPVTAKKYELHLPDGRVQRGALGADGRIRVNNIEPGVGYLLFPAEEATAIDASSLDDAGEPEDAPEGPNETEAATTTNWVCVQLVDADGVPVAGKTVELRFADGSVQTVDTDASGNARLEEIPQGPCEVSIPDVDPNSWAVA